MLEDGEHGDRAEPLAHVEILWEPTANEMDAAQLRPGFERGIDADSASHAFAENPKERRVTAAHVEDADAPWQVACGLGDAPALEKAVEGLH
jgi:hypothetical protein